jgi:hypothetical protein
MNRRTWFGLARLSLALLVAGTLGCRDEGLPGTYHATTFTMQQTGASTTDILAAGGSITLTIAGDLSTTGSLKLPANVQGGPTTVSLLGSAALIGNEVTLNLVADTFMRDATWTFEGSALSTVYTSSGVTAVVTLSK